MSTPCSKEAGCKSPNHYTLHLLSVWGKRTKVWGCAIPSGVWTRRIHIFWGSEGVKREVTQHCRWGAKASGILGLSQNFHKRLHNNCKTPVWTASVQRRQDNNANGKKGKKKETNKTLWAATIWNACSMDTNSQDGFWLRSWLWTPKVGISQVWPTIHSAYGCFQWGTWYSAVATTAGLAQSHRLQFQDLITNRKKLPLAFRETWISNVTVGYMW